MIMPQGDSFPRLEGRHRLTADAAGGGRPSLAPSVLTWAEDQQMGPAGRLPLHEPDPAAPVLVDATAIAILRARHGHA